VTPGRGHAGDEIVHSRWKHRGRVNPLVLGSNPSGPTNFKSIGIRQHPLS
jgi:hypothetical protein